MLLKQIKESVEFLYKKKLKIFFSLIICVFLANLLFLNPVKSEIGEVEFAFDEDIPSEDSEVGVTNMVKSELSSTKIISGFFEKDNLGKTIGLGESKNLNGLWVGDISFSNESIVWKSSNFKSSSNVNIFDLKNLNLNIASDTLYIQKIKIDLGNLKYGQINFQKVSDEKINFWSNTEYENKNYILRGKLVRITDNELFTVLLITVYDKNIPLYAVEGQSILKK